MFHPPLPQPLRLREVEGGLVVITPGDIVGLIAKNDASLAAALRQYYADHPSEAFAHYTITETQYRALLDNQAELLRYVRDNAALIRYYRQIR